MCLGIAGQIIEFLPEPRDVARVNVFGVERVINIGLVANEGLNPGDWVLIHVGFAIAKMDEAEAKVALDLAGRPFFRFDGRFERERVGALPTELVPHFFRSLSDALKATLHVSVTGENTHHMVEACFKGVGRALRQACQRSGQGLPSTKGLL